MKSNKFILIPVAAIVLVVLGVLALLTRIKVPQKERLSTIPEQISIKTASENVLAEGFPDIPIHPESKIINSYKKEENGLVGYEANLETTLPGFKIISWYKEELIQLDWTIYDESLGKESGELYLRAEKDGLKANIFEDSDDEQTIISIEIPYH